MLAPGFTYTQPRFLRGDVDADGVRSITDAVVTLQFRFLGGASDCLSAADANHDGEVDVSDPIRLLFHLFLAGWPLPPPGPTPGTDPTPDGLPCSRVES